MKFVYHVDAAPAECRIDGRNFLIPPNTLFEVLALKGFDFTGVRNSEYVIPEEKVTEELVKQCAHHGLVEVPVKRVGNNFETDVQAAQAAASARLLAADEKCVMDYVRQQQERRQQNSAIMPPGGRTLQVIEKNKIDLKAKYGLEPVGYGAVANAQAEAAEKAEMREEMAALRKTVRDLAASSQQSMLQPKGGRQPAA